MLSPMLQASPETPEEIFPVQTARINEGARC
jgi:hypothetical protein